ncbi:hypothetical protein BST61_g2969 [Cercospora zeina]
MNTQGGNAVNCTTRSIYTVRHSNGQEQDISNDQKSKSSLTGASHTQDTGDSAPGSAPFLTCPRKHLGYPACEDIFLSQHALDQHLIRSHGYQYQCQACKETKKELFALRAHQIREHRESCKEFLKPNLVPRYSD